MKKPTDWARQVLSQNLKKLMDRPGAKRISSYQVAGYRKGEEQGDRVLSPRTVSRMKSGEIDVTLDHLQAVADFFLLEPWQLLVKNFNPDDPPHLALSDSQRQAYKKMEQSLEALKRVAEGESPSEIPGQPHK